MKRIAILTSATGGGAGIAATRVYESLLESPSTDFTVELIDMKLIGEAIDTDVADHRGGSNKQISDTHFTVEHPGYVRSFVVAFLRGYDLLNIHWASYLVTSDEILVLARLGVKILITMHDFYYALGGCHYPSSCLSWTQGCNSCPQLDQERFPTYNPSLSKKKKEELFRHSNVCISAPSEYVLEFARRASGINAKNCHLIRNPIDLGVFNSIERSHFIASPRNHISIMLIADSGYERRKGFHLAYESLCHLNRRDNQFDFDVVIIGKGNTEIAHHLLAEGVNARGAGHIDNPKLLSRLYQNATVLLSTSYEDNWPNVLVESYACGTMAVVGPGHGCSEFLNAYGFGRISESYTPAHFADALTEVYYMLPNYDSLRAAYLKRFLLEHDPVHVGKKYSELLLSILEIA